MEVFELIYENNLGEVVCRYKSLEDIQKIYGLNKREVLSYYTGVKVPKFDSIVKSISKVFDESTPNTIENYRVIFD
jgi:hypothetical protein